MDSVVVRFPLGRAPGGERHETEQERPEQPRDGRVAWPRMSAEAVARVLGQRPRRCLERIEFDLGVRDRIEGRRAPAGASISYRRGYAFRAPRRRSLRAPRFEVVA